MTMPLPQDIIPKVVPWLINPPEIPGLAAVTDIGAGIGAVRRWVSDRHNWVRVAWTVGGLVLMASGVAVMAGKPAASAVRTATKVVHP